MKTKTSKFILLAASALIIFAINPLPVLAQSSCPSYASLAITSSKTSYQVGEIFSGEVVFTNNIVPANVNFDVKAVKSGQTLISNNYTLATQVGRNVYQLTDALGVSSLPEAGVYTISIIASYPFPICSWNANLTLTATSPAPVAPPQIQQLIPDSRLPGEQVIIKGSNFTPTGNDVKSGTTVIASNLPSAGGDTIVFTVPGASPDQYPISVSNSRGASNEKTLTVLGAPRIDSLNPSSAPFGSTITINGSGFTPTGNNLKSGSVFFDLNISSPDGKTLTFIVPDVSPGSYPVAVQNQRGISNEASFTVLAAKPEIQSLNPSSAQPYTQITVKGANFTRTGNDVKSGATVIASGVPSNGTVLNFTVPDVSPGSYPVSVSNRRGVSNEVSFTVLPPPPVKLLTSLTILPSEYLLGQTVTGSVILTNPTPKEIKANFSIELYKDSTLFWQRQVKSLSIPPSPGPAPRVVSYSLDDVFGFKPTIPDNPSFVGNWKLLIKRTDTGPGAAPDDSVSQTFLIKAPFIPPLALTFNFDPKEYILGDTLQGKGTITNPGSLPVIADFKIELFQGTTLKWQREIKGISVPSGTSPFTVDDLFGFKVVIPNEVSLIGDWKLKISQIETTPPVSVESSFSIKSITAACKPTTGTPAAKAFGIVQGFFPWSTSPKDLDYMKELGVKWARLELVWDKIEPQRSQFNWEFYDTVVKSFEENNIQILGQFGSAPCWANGRPCPFQNPLEHDYPPTDLDAWANFVKKAAERYKPGGVLGLKTGITHWEIWNEPNIDIFWRPAPNPKEYANLLAVSNKAIREVDSKAIIVGVSEAGVEPTFVDAIYKAGAKNCFDVISLHPYGPVSELQGKTAGIKKFLKDHGDPDKPIWYTEYGFITGKSGEPGSVGPKVSEQEQAQYVKETYELFSQGVFPAMFWISLKDFGTPARPEDTFGLLRLDYSKKPAFDVLKNLLKGITPTPGISIDVDAAKIIKNIQGLKPSINIFQQWDSGIYTTNKLKWLLNKYNEDIGIKDRFVRVQEDWPELLTQDTSVFSEIIKLDGKPIILFNDMPMSLAKDPTNPNFYRLPPRSYEEWQNYVYEVVKKYKALGVRNYEIWNEADLDEYWLGNQDEFLKLYESTVKGIIAADPSALIFGPATTDIGGEINPGDGPLILNLIDYAKSKSLPLHFVTWHDYDNNPSSPSKEQIGILRKKLNDNGYTSTLLVVDEWSPIGGNNRGDIRLDSEYSSALIVSQVAGFVYSGVDYQSLYDFIEGNNDQAFLGLYGIFTPEGVIKAKYNALKVLAKTDDNLAYSTLNGNPSNLIFSTKSDNKVSLVLSNPSNARIPNVKINLKNIPQQFIHYTKYIIDATHSNAYAVKAKIKTRMEQGKSEALISAKEIFSAALRDRGWNAFKRFLVQRYLDKYLANPDDPGVKALFSSLTPQEQSDVAYAFGRAMDKYNQVIESVADEINNWPEVKLYSETKTIAVPGGTYGETLSLEPYAVQVILLSK